MTEGSQGGQGSRNSAPAKELTKDMNKLLYLISRILVQHEDSINAAKMDRFTVFEPCRTAHQPVPGEHRMQNPDSRRCFGSLATESKASALDV